MWKIGDIEIQNKIVVAPMAGVSNLAFRSICKEFGAGLIYTEMLSDKALYFDNIKTLAMSQIAEQEHPISMQLFGHDRDSMVYAAKLLDTQTDCDIIDINMGCPVHKIVKSNAGSALMKDGAYAVSLVEEIVKNVKKPVTVKMRIGWDDQNQNCIALAKALECVGVKAIALHARTRTQMYEGKADWRYIKEMKQALSIPVIGNGDIKSVEDMQRMLKETGCDAVMIGRGVLGNPWLLKECEYYLKTNQQLETISYQEKFALILQHAKRLCALKGESVGIKEMRGHAAWYIKGLPLSHRVKEKISNMKTYQELLMILKEYQIFLSEDK
ncbi:MAG: tRNA dihydrouridine synthase DusB [Breznakia sp.]